MVNRTHDICHEANNLVMNTMQQWCDWVYLHWLSTYSNDKKHHVPILTCVDVFTYTRNSIRLNKPNYKNFQKWRNMWNLQLSLATPEFIHGVRVSFDTIVALRSIIWALEAEKCVTLSNCDFSNPISKESEFWWLYY